MTKIVRTFLACLVATTFVAAPITASAQTKQAADPATKHLAYLCKSRNIVACNHLCAGGKYWVCKVGNNIHTF
jgi:phosphoribosyl-dephospho-CoA transferase